jgi:hypothetical protein
VLEDVKSSGRWQQLYDLWLDDLIDPDPAPPPPTYSD